MEILILAGIFIVFFVILRIAWAISKLIFRLLIAGTVIIAILFVLKYFFMVS